MPNKEESINVKVTEEEKRRFIDGAEKRDMTTSGLMREATDFYLAFPKEFLDVVKISADPLKMAVPTVIVYLLNYYLAQENALIEFFKKHTGAATTHTFKRAFQYNQQGLIDSDEISEKVQKEITEKLEAIWEKSQKAHRAGKKPELNLEEDLLLSQRV